MSIFINPAVTKGITTFIRDKNENRVFAPFCFEKTVIMSLIAIYDEVNIINSYTTGDQALFLNALRKYGLGDETITTFLSDFDALSRFIVNNKNQAVKTKTNLLVSLEKSLMNMFLLKSKQVAISDTEIEGFEKTLFVEKCGNPTQVLFGVTISEDIKDLSMFWEFKKYQIKNPVVLKTQVMPTFLPEEDYLAFGFTSDMIKTMTKEQIDDLNQKITAYKNQMAPAPQRFGLRPSTGDTGGFVNNLIVILVIAICVLVSVILIVKIWKCV